MVNKQYLTKDYKQSSESCKHNMGINYSQPKQSIDWRDMHIECYPNQTIQSCKGCGEIFCIINTTDMELIAAFLTK